MGKKIDSKLLRKEVRKVTGMKDDDEDFTLALVMLSAAVVGPSAAKIAALTDLPRAKCRAFCATLRAQGIFVGRKIRHSGWFDKDGGIAFNLDIAVAKGWMERRSA